MLGVGQRLYDRYGLAGGVGKAVPDRAEDVAEERERCGSAVGFGECGVDDVAAEDVSAGFTPQGDDVGLRFGELCGRGRTSALRGRLSGRAGRIRAGR